MHFIYSYSIVMVMMIQNCQFLPIAFGNDNKHVGLLYIAAIFLFSPFSLYLFVLQIISP